MLPAGGTRSPEKEPCVLIPGEVPCIEAVRAIDCRSGLGSRTGEKGGRMRRLLVALGVGALAATTETRTRASERRRRRGTLR